MSELIGQEVAGFRVVREIARGGMGVVFEAEQVRLGRPVALKMLHPALTVDQDFLRRFEREAKILARLNHEGIVNVIDFFEHDDRHFLALEFVEGETLSRRLRRCARQRRFFPLREAAMVVWQVAQALSFAHARQIIHRDLKPDNIMLTPRERAKVMDFGIARVGQGASQTEVGARVGTPDYMAPEQLKGRPADARSDLFALGLVFYEMLIGRRPFSQTDLVRSDTGESLPVPWDEDRLPLGSDRIRPIIENLLVVDPDGRYGSAGELIEDMRERLGAEVLGEEVWATPPTPRAAAPVRAEETRATRRRRRRIRRLIAVPAIASLIAGGVFYHRWQQERFAEQQQRLEGTRANFQAFIADSQDRIAEAEHLFLRAIAVEPTVVRYWRDLGDFYVKHGRASEAVDLYRKTLELDPSDLGTAKRLQAILAATATTQTLPSAPPMPR